MSCVGEFSRLNDIGKHRFFADNAKNRFLHESDELLQNGLDVDQKDYCFVDNTLSAKFTATRLQTLLIVMCLGLCLISLYFYKETSIVIGSIFISFFYLCVVIFRAKILSNFDQRLNYSQKLYAPSPNTGYVVLVALYNEANQIAGLIKALKKLQWPEGKKSIKLICEEDDLSTIHAIRSIAKPSYFELLIVPAGPIKTKPRALNYALLQADGAYLVIYDAEDRPHPLQLLEAENTFRNSPEALACLQSPLAIDNKKESALTRFFSIEYDTLFLGILPVLGKWRMPIPLGGTSNHFRLNLLKKIGGWDSYNVTEDADLGIRLARKGYYCQSLKFPTFEEAPCGLDDWLPQRTRWLKGWMQTLLVNTRQPLKCGREMGWSHNFQFHLILTSVIISALIHPFFMIALASQLTHFFSGQNFSHYDIWMTGMSVFNLIAGYSVYVLQAHALQLAKNGKSQLGTILLFPIYWLLISVAGWRGLFQLIFCPHKWEKTNHGSKKRLTPKF